MNDMDNELSPEDSLRLQVLLHSDLKAVRLDESFMTLYGLTKKGEASIPLSPTCQNEKYLSMVRSYLSEHTLGTTGGYPLYLKRWTRMGQTAHPRLKDLLMLADSEAVMAVSNAPDLSYELAVRAWWCAMNTEQQPDIARYLLVKEAVLSSDKGTELGQELVNYLLEYLPFMEDVGLLLHTLKLLVQSNLLNQTQNEMLWKRGKNKSVYHLAFIIVKPNDLPKHDLSFDKPIFITKSQHLLLETILEKSQTLAGQNFLRHVSQTLKKISAEDIIYPLLNTIGQWFKIGEFLPVNRSYLNFVEQLDTDFDRADGQLNDFIQKNLSLKKQAYAIYALSGVYEEIVFEAILHSGAVGSQLRKRVKPMTDFIQTQLTVLLDKSN